MMNYPMNLSRSAMHDTANGKTIYIYSTILDGANSIKVAEMNIANVLGLPENKIAELTRRIAMHFSPKETLDAVKERVEREWQLGDLTQLGVVNHLVRGGFNQSAAIELAKTICA